ncbi:MAG: SCO family protein [Myxococcota bacterium]
MRGLLLLPTLTYLLSSSALAQPSLADVGVVERLHERLPLDATFTDSTGRAVALRELFAEGRPTVLALVYYRCPTLCGLVLDGLVGSLRQTGMRLGEDYSVIALSIDPTEGPREAAAKKKEAMAALGGQEEAWSFLTGPAEEIRAVAEAVGFRYAYDEEAKLYAHAAVLVLLTPQGRISRYVYGVRYPPRELRWALVEAAGGKVGTSLDRVLLTCFRYDPATRRYEPYVKGFFRIGALVFLFALSGLLAVLWRREIKGDGRGR